jgi:hypothetical protein
VTPDRAKQPRTAVRRWSVAATDSEAYFHVRDKLAPTVIGSLPIEASGVTLTDGDDITDRGTEMSTELDPPDSR